MERKKKFISSNSMYFFYIKKDTSHEFEREMCLIYLNIKKSCTYKYNKNNTLKKKGNFLWAFQRLQC